MSKLEEMLKYVSEHNEFYKNRIKEYGIKDPLDITQWPILTRKELQENRYNMFSDGYKSKYFNQQLRRQSSSGSSGVPVNVYWDYKDWYASNMSLWRKRLQWYGIHPSDKCVMFSLSEFNTQAADQNIYYVNTTDNMLFINTALINKKDGYNIIIDLINDFSPRWLYIQPTILWGLLNAYQKNNKKTPSTLKHIETVGELLAPSLKKKAIDYFGVSVSNMYGSEEMNGIAYECPYNQMHILDDNVKLEVESNDKLMSFGEGAAVLTNVNNKAMPLIRYYQGDNLELRKKNEVCSCGCRSPIIDIINGRIYNCIELDNGHVISSLTLLEIMAQINNQYGDIIRDFKFYFYRFEKLLKCMIVLETQRQEWFPQIKKIICKKILELSLLDIKLEVSLDNIEKTNITKKTILEIVE